MKYNTKSIKQYTPDCFTQTKGNRPKSETLYWINYIKSDQCRLAYWRDRGPWGAGFYAVQHNSTFDKDIINVEPAIYTTPDQYQQVQGLYHINDFEKW